MRTTCLLRHAQQQACRYRTSQPDASGAWLLPPQRKKTADKGKPCRSMAGRKAPANATICCAPSPVRYIPCHPAKLSQIPRATGRAGVFQDIDHCDAQQSGDGQLQAIGTADLAQYAKRPPDCDGQYQHHAPGCAACPLVQYADQEPLFSQGKARRCAEYTGQCAILGQGIPSQYTQQGNQRPGERGKRWMGWRRRRSSRQRHASHHSVCHLTAP